MPYFTPVQERTPDRTDCYVLADYLFGATLRPSCPARLSVDSLDELCGSDLEAVGQLEDIQQRNVAASALNLRNVVSVKVRQFRQIFLA